MNLVAAEEVPVPEPVPLPHPIDPQPAPTVPQEDPEKGRVPPISEPGDHPKQLVA